MRSTHAASTAWTLLNPTVTSPIVGARTLKPLEDNLGTLDVTFTADQRRRLDDISTFELGFPHHMLSRPMTRAVMFGDVKIQPRA